MLVRIARRALTVVMALAVAVVALPTVVAATVTCCCGEHDAGHDCGCRDCPAGHADDHDDDDTPTVKRCRSQAGQVTLASTPMLAPTTTTTVDAVALPAPRVEPAPLADRPAEPPQAPPPRTARDLRAA